jgi:hypothetical protein
MIKSRKIGKNIVENEKFCSSIWVYLFLSTMSYLTFDSFCTQMWENPLCNFDHESLFFEKLELAALLWRPFVVHHTLWWYRIIDFDVELQLAQEYLKEHCIFQANITPMEIPDLTALKAYLKSRSGWIDSLYKVLISTYQYDNLAFHYYYSVLDISDRISQIQNQVQQSVHTSFDD